jgi:hypothetical protein
MVMSSVTANSFHNHYVAKLRYNVFHAVQTYEIGSTNTMIVLKQKEDRYHPNHFRQRNEVNGGHVLITGEHVIPKRTGAQLACSNAHPLLPTAVVSFHMRGGT